MAFAVRTCRQFTTPLKVRWIRCQKSPFLIDKTTINCHFQQQTASLPGFFCRFYSTSSSVIRLDEKNTFFFPTRHGATTEEQPGCGWGRLLMAVGGPGCLWPKWPLTGGIPHGTGAVCWVNPMKNRHKTSSKLPHEQQPVFIQPHQKHQENHHSNPSKTPWKHHWTPVSPII